MSASDSYDDSAKYVPRAGRSAGTSVAVDSGVPTLAYSDPAPPATGQRERERTPDVERGLYDGRGSNVHTAAFDSIDSDSASADCGRRPDDRPRSPCGRTARVIRAVPGVDRVLRVANTILGPEHRQPPPPPTPSLLLSATCNRHAASGSLDALVMRTCRRWRLHQLWFPYLLLWATGLILLVRAAYYLPGAPDTLSCTSTYWPDWPPDYCGENGTACAPGLASGTYKCPGGCATTPLGNPRWIGNDTVNGVPLIVGGGDPSGTYRADSWLCPAAVHAGLVSPTFGGCIKVTTLPFPEGSSSFVGSRGHSGLYSLPFAPHYPAAFQLARGGSSADCIEFHWPISSYNIVLLFVFTVFFTPPPAVLAAVLVVLGYLQIMLASDPPSRPPDWSVIMGGVLPVLFTGYWIWKVSLRRTLTGFITAGLTLDMAIWQGAGFWIGIESSTLFAKVPISRLGYGALPAGGVIALIIIIIVVVIVVAIQVFEYRRLGYFRYYLKRYLPIVPVLILLANLGHGYYLRMHHYILALLGLPVLSLPNRISLFGQAFLLGYFLDGVGRWGWASIIQQGSDLLGDANAGTLLPALNVTASLVSWPPINETLAELGVIAFSLLLDDLVWSEEYRGHNFSIEQTDADRSTDHYLRMAYVANGTSLDYTLPWTWFAHNQSWGGVV